ncbi:MAG: YihA family ribosome biogenesis GTP-binding protein [Synergistetes bacterium]|nr:YihA family ribosome biogenesis GTP-binding protein [Synergistota bacterium]
MKRERKLIASVYLPERIPLPWGLPEIAVAGRSNVGKSSFINVLLGEKLARTSSTPGKTRSLNFYLIDRKFILVDLPGYGYAKVSLSERERWARLVEAYVRKRGVILGFLQIIDIRHIPMDNDLRLFEWLSSLELPVGFIFTKIDKLSRSSIKVQVEKAKRYYPLEKWGYVLFSALTGEGKKEAWNLIENLIHKKGGEYPYGA